MTGGQVSPDRAELEKLLDKDVDELLVLLAQSDPENAETMFSSDEARDAGRHRFDRLSAPLRRRICDEWHYCEKKAQGNLSDNVDLAVAVADVITTVVGGLPVSLITALVIKRGLNQLCGCGGSS